ncbi:MAG: Exonuclease SbcC [candidate division TM6 bacterium GW2011_GWF2_32_72]|nr:MAG: Exonuclease SbcC [candidate division TM6 bacterium GW2011_GWF2_32_72]
MIPIKLQLKNFLSYGSEIQTINFENYPLICLSGKNGHGKSALLDGITWAIWGQARKTGATVKPDQGLLRLGQTQMMASLDFEFNKQIYRVKREFFKTYGKPVQNLDFALIQSDGTSKSLSEKNIRSTQEIIEKTLGLDYETFSNSAFIRQGNSNEFSKKSPKDRKEVLSNILGLNKFEKIRLLAAEKIRNLKTKISGIEQVQEHLKQEAEKKGLVESQTKEIKQFIKEILEQETDIEKELKKIQSKENELNQKQQIKKQWLEKKENNLKLKQELERKLLNTISLWKNTHKKLLQQPNLNKLEQQKHEANKHLNLLQQQLQKNLESKESLLGLKEQENKLISELNAEYTKKTQTKEMELEKNKDQITFIQKRIAEEDKLVAEFEKNYLEITNQIKQLSKDLIFYEGCLKKREIQERTLEKGKNHYQKWITQANLHQSELKEITLRKTVAHDLTNPCCPLCEQNLSLSRKKFLATKLEKQEQATLHKFNRLKTLIPKLKEKLIADHELFKELKEQEEKQRELKAKIKNLAEKQTELSASLAKQQELKLKQQLEIQKHEKEQISLTEEFKTLEHTQLLALQKNNTLSEIRAKIIEFQTQLEASKYNSQEHKKIQEQLERLEEEIRFCVNIQTEEALQQQRKETIHEYCIALRNQKINLLKSEVELKTVDTLDLDLEQTLQNKNDHLEKQRETQKTKEASLKRLASLETLKEKITESEKKHFEQEKEKNKIYEEAQELSAIYQAMSKDGIQALLIEDALPEIEQEANLILGKLTNNQAQIFIESLKDLKSGGVKETLDINISDNMGIRPYEMFSGGEAFRIDFALRVAISKLLARRSGTCLQTLIIDEGFGSQDEEGLNLIMEAIHRIQEDFSKIIVVSHLHSMKDHFPAHFLIEKGLGGSSVRILEQS